MQKSQNQPPDDSEAELMDDVAIANLILADQGVVDSFGHVSARSRRNPEHFYMARYMAPNLVTPADITLFGLDGELVEPDGSRSYSERFIHSEIYAAKPEVQAVVHSHSPSIIPFGLTDVPLRAVYHMGGFLGTSTPVFEIREGGGDDSDMMITTPYLGSLLARKLGDKCAVLMRGHGSTTVGNSVRQAVYRAVYAELNARLMTEALRLGNGKITYLNEQEAANAARANDRAVDRPWNNWKASALARR